MVPRTALCFGSRIRKRVSLLVSNHHLQVQIRHSLSTTMEGAPPVIGEKRPRSSPEEVEAEPVIKRAMAGEKPELELELEPKPKLTRTKWRIHIFPSWEDACVPRRRAPVRYNLAVNIPDHLYARDPEDVRRHNMMSPGLLRSHILEQTARDDWRAAHIDILGMTADNIAPGWNFSYGNAIWHGPGAPTPEIEQLKACSCEGRCATGEQSECACLRRHREQIGLPSFAYGDGGELEFPEEPYVLWECNRFCGCDESSCQNRVSLHRVASMLVLTSVQVVQHGRRVGVNITHYGKKGWGVSIHMHAILAAHVQRRCFSLGGDNQGLLHWCLWRGDLVWRGGRKTHRVGILCTLIYDDKLIERLARRMCFTLTSLISRRQGLKPPPLTRIGLVM